MKTLYTCMLSKDIFVKRIITDDPRFVLLIDFYDGSRTSIGFYEQDGKIGIKAFQRESLHTRKLL